MIIVVQAMQSVASAERSSWIDSAESRHSIAGMILAKRGYKVSIFEKEGVVGGDH
jgi:hypothetical protein